jgi:hypothetical protein
MYPLSQQSGVDTLHEHRGRIDTEGVINTHVIAPFSAHHVSLHVDILLYCTSIMHFMSI